MECKKIRENLIEYILNREEITDSVKKRIENHLKRCPKCREEYEVQKKYLQKYKELFAPFDLSDLDEKFDKLLKRIKNRNNFNIFFSSIFYNYSILKRIVSFIIFIVILVGICIICKLNY